MYGMKSASSADAPFEECSKNLKMHCVDSAPGRHGLCGYKLDPARTEKERKDNPGVCCYDVRD